MEAGPEDFLYAVLSLTVIRLLPVAVSLLGTKLAPVTVLFVGWFGPRGLASVIYLLLIVEAGDIGAENDIFVTVVLTVFLSVLLHGLSATPAARLYGAYLRRQEEAGESGAEHRHVAAFATRLPPASGRKRKSPPA